MPKHPWRNHAVCACGNDRAKQRVNTPWLSECCQAVNKLSTSCQEKKYFLPKHIFSSQQTKILTFTQKLPKIITVEIFRVAVRWLSRGCQEAVRRLSGKIHHNFEAKIKFGRWFRYHRKAYPTPSVLTPAKIDLRFRLSRGCSPSARSLAQSILRCVLLYILLWKLFLSTFEKPNWQHFFAMPSSAKTQRRCSMRTFEALLLHYCVMLAQAQAEYSRLCQV